MPPLSLLEFAQFAIESKALLPALAAEATSLGPSRDRDPRSGFEGSAWQGEFRTSHMQNCEGIHPHRATVIHPAVSLPVYVCSVIATLRSSQTERPKAENPDPPTKP